MAEPKVRFKTDDGNQYPAWSQKAFSKVFYAINNNTYSRDQLNYDGGYAKNIHYGDILVKYGDICDIQNNTIPYINDGLPVQKYTPLRDGDIILADTAEDETVGKAIEIFNIKNDIVVSGLHTMVCRPNDSYAPKYLGYYMNCPAFHDQLRPFMQGIKVTSIGRNNIADVVLSIPESSEEQRKIASFLSSVDEIIFTSENEVTNLELQKKAVMKKIFSQEVRFKREDGSEFPDWEEEELGAIALAKVGNKPDEILEEKTNFEYINAGTTKSGYVNGYNREGDVTTTPSRGQGGIGFVGYQKRAFWLGPLCYGIQSRVEHVMTKYLYFYLDNNSDCILDCVKTGSIPAVNQEDLIQILVNFPSIEEQRLIADFLSNFDEAITAAKKELELWKELKKGLLQQMFV